MLRIALAIAVLSAAACAEDPPDADPVFTDLRAALDAPDLAVIGVTIDPDDNARYVLDESLGLYRLTDTVATLVVSIADMPVPDVPFESAFTDVAALGDDRFAITAKNDGYILDLTTNTFGQHFCYVPGDLPYDEDVHQMTHSVTYDPSAGLLYAQPQTFGVDSGLLLASEVGQFDLATGEPLAWASMPDIEYIAGAITLEQTGVVLLGNGSEVARWTITDGQMGATTDLGRFGIERIEGLAVDRENETLLVVDGASDELVELPLDVLN
jgi:hypothetical protein